MVTESRKISKDYAAGESLLAQTRRLLRRGGLQARKGLGQHFLIDGGVLRMVTAAAALTPVREYYRLIREICDRHNVLWIADEVMAGVGRTGSFLAIEAWDGSFHNRSRYAALHTIPIPTAVWLLGSGFVGLVGLRGKLKN